MKNPLIHEDADFACGIEARNTVASWRRRLSSWGLLLSEGGTGTLELDSGESYTAGAGEILIYKPGFSFRFEIEESWGYTWFHFALREHMTAVCDFPEVIPGLGVFKPARRDYRRIRVAMAEARELERLRPPGWYPLAMLLIENILQRACNSVACRSSRNRERVEKAIDCLTSRHGMSIDEVARQCGISEPLLYEIFRRETGLSPRKYQELHQLRRAQVLLLNSSLSMTEIAAELGMCDQYYFSNRFKKNFGLSPTAFRRQAQNKL